MLSLKMGSYYSFLYSWAYGKRETQILILGLDASGKTTLLTRLKTGTNSITVPTIGFNTEQFEFGNLKFFAWDIGGQDQIRRLWSHYYANTNAIVFVVDSSDTQRMSSAKDELDNLHRQELLKDIPFLVFANKQDLPRALTASQVASRMDLHSIKTRKWKIFDCVGITGDGVHEGFTWLSENV
tara:strand:- start:1062 stop:1610 length:549 start_codon:yes stop_codon:yes gene_type:complete